MKSILLPAVLSSALMVLSPGASADPLSVGGADSLQEVLRAQVGKRVALKIRSGEELAGTLKSVNGEVVHLGELTGKEFYDAVIEVEAIEAVVIRVK